MQINVLEAKTNLSTLLKRAEAGEEVIIARSGQPAAKLVALDPPPLIGTPEEIRAAMIIRGLICRPRTASGRITRKRGNIPFDEIIRDLEQSREER